MALDLFYLVLAGSDQREASTNVNTEEYAPETDIESGHESIIPLPQFEGNIFRKMDENVTVQTGLGGKKQSCLYCGNLYSKLARHLESIHSDEIEVAQALGPSFSS